MFVNLYDSANCVDTGRPDSRYNNNQRTKFVPLTYYGRGGACDEEVSSWIWVSDPGAGWGCRPAHDHGRGDVLERYRAHSAAQLPELPPARFGGADVADH